VIWVVTFHHRLQPQRHNVRTPPVRPDPSLGHWHPSLAWDSCGLDIPVWILTSFPPVPRALPLVRQPCHFLFSRFLKMFNRVNHWLVLITFLQHTDPLLPHYRSEEFTFPRGALSTLDRNLLGDLGSLMGWIGATVTHGISETHVAHHVSSKIPHYNA
jgi:fatty acid desaturase